MANHIRSAAAGLFAALATLSCVGAASPAPEARPFPDAAYAGTIPAASGPGIDVILELFPDGTWASTETYVDRAGGPTIDGGAVEASERGFVLHSGAEPRFRVRPEGSTLRLLDQEGERIEGPLEDLYVLSRIAETFVSVRPTDLLWLLVELEGLNVQAPPPRPQVTLTLEADSSWAVGIGGCNRYRAQYSFQGMYGLSVSAGISTKMACPDMELETHYYGVLSRVRRYRLIDERLYLYGEQGAPLAVFRREGDD